MTWRLTLRPAGLRLFVADWRRRMRPHKSAHYFLTPLVEEAMFCPPRKRGGQLTTRADVAEMFREHFADVVDVVEVDDDDDCPF